MENETNVPERENIAFLHQHDSEEILKITKDGFYYKGERVDDIHNVYERFNEWMRLAEIRSNKAEQLSSEK